MFTIHNFTELENLDLYIPHNIVSLSYTDLSKNDPSLPHSHPHTEIMIVAEGNGYLAVNNQKIPFQRGKLYFVNPNTEHFENSDNTLKYYVIKISNFTVYKTDEFAEVISFDIDYSVQKNILTRLTQTLEDCNLKGRERNSLLALDLAYLYYYFVHILDNNYYISHMAIKRNSSKIQAVVNYISANYVLDLKVSELAKKFSFSHNNLIYHFRKELNMSPIEFITFQRLQAAKNLLQNTDYTVTQIASLCGFAHPSFFGKVFQQHEGMSPSDYRKKNTL